MTIIIPSIEDGHAICAAFLPHFLSLASVLINIVFGKSYAFRVEIFARFFAIRTPICHVQNDGNITCVSQSRFFGGLLLCRLRLPCFRTHCLIQLDMFFCGLHFRRRRISINNIAIAVLPLVYFPESRCREEPGLNDDCGGQRNALPGKLKPGIFPRGRLAQTVWSAFIYNFLSSLKIADTLAQQGRISTGISLVSRLPG